MNAQSLHLRQCLRGCWFVFLLLCVSITLRAQQPPQMPPPPVAPPAPPPEAQVTTLPPAPPCAGCYKGFEFDSTFQIGAHFNGNWIGAMRMAKDTLHIGITQFYHGPVNLRRTLDTTQWQQVGSPPQAWQVRQRWWDSLQTLFFRSMDSAGMKFIYGPGFIPDIGKESEASEAYYGQASGDTLHRVDFNRTSPADSIDRPARSFVWGGVFRKSSSTTQPFLMAGGPQYTLGGLERPGMDTLYKLAGHPEDANTYDLSFALNVTQDSVFQNVLGTNSLIAYTKVFRRVQLGQSDCKCNLYALIDSLAITKGAYLDTARSDPSAGNGYRDITFSFQFPDTFITPARKLLIEKKPGVTITALDTGRSYPVYVSRAGFLGWHSKADEADTTGCARFCARLRDSLASRGYIVKEIISRDTALNYSDVYYDVYTTRRVDVAFMRGRTAPRTYALLRRGDFNTTIRGTIDSVMSDPIMKRLMARIGVTDEQNIFKYKGHMDLAARVQRAILLKDPNDTRGIWGNPMGNSSSFRVLSGDLDTTQIRIMHMMANQIYNFGGRIPVAYANPDKMKYSKALDGFYRAKGPIPPPPSDRWNEDRIIDFNTASDYQHYTEQTQAATGTRIDQLTDLVNTARFRFRHIRRESYPVLSVVQVHGFLETIKAINAQGNVEEVGYTGRWDLFRPTTPEEITLQSWLALNCGLDGLWFSDFTYDHAKEFGVIHWNTGRHDSDYQEGLHPEDPGKQQPEYRLPKMWTGFKSRFAAVKRITDEFHDRILPVYTKLDRNGVRMSVHRDGFRAMPMLDTLYTRLAKRDKDGAGKYQDSSAFDSKAATYIEATVFRPGGRDTNRLSNYLLVTSRRCWPVDYQTYSYYVDSLHPGSASAGFGAIDARKPVVVLKNSTGILADSARIERIGDTVSRTVAFGVPVELEWLDPGWGAMYRITPVLAPVSALGTAYNNAVHGENPSTNGAAKDRLIVYERDSVIYLRSMDSAGRWSKEYMISSTADSIRSVIVSGRRRNRADNMQPALATVRNGTSCLVVWERQSNISGLSTVEMAWLPTLPTRTTFPDSKTIIRRTLSAPRAFSQTWMRLTPSVVGVDSGYIVAWAAPDYTTEIKAVRDKLGNGRYDTSRVLRLKDPGILPNLPKDSATGYPTLAYVRNWTTIPLNGGKISGPNDTTEWISMPPHVNGIPDTTGTYHVAHLAYQQGTRNAPNLWEIMYNKLGVRFPPLPPGANAGVPELWASETEDVSVNLQGCNFMHPSIAADSIRVGVAFTRQWSRDNIVLRFRDMDTLTPRLIRWNTTAYQWGGADFRAGRFAFPTGFKDYTRASLTLFPSRDSATLANSYEGALTWRWTNAPDGRRHGTKLYRFGKLGIDTLPDGEHPSMILVPYIGATAARAMSATGIFRRGNDASAFELRRGWGDTGVYYTAFLDNTPASPLEMFTQSPPSDTIFSSFDIRNNNGMMGQFGCTMAGGGIGGGVILGRPRGYPPPPPPPPPPVVPPAKEWGVPPTFFPPGIRGPKALGSLLDASGITRTGAFTADSTTVTLTRVLMGNDSLIAWLNTQPYDSNAGRPANIFFAMQLVRQSDSAVLWSGDTVSARAVGNDTLEEAVTVPVNTAATPGTVVYIRLMAATTPGLSYRLSGGFHFLQDGVGGTGAKRVRQAKPQEGTEAESAIGVEMVPNPLRNTEGELRIRTTATGAATVTVFDLLGRPLLTVPAFTAESAGEYVVPVDLRQLGNGAYLVRVEIGRNRGVTQFSIMR